MKETKFGYLTEEWCRCCGKYVISLDFYKNKDCCINCYYLYFKFPDYTPEELHSLKKAAKEERVQEERDKWLYEF